MNIKKITVHSPDDIIGDTDTGTENCALYRTWLTFQLHVEYPDATVEVVPEPGWLEVNGENVTAAQVDQVERFVSRCWDICPWNFI